MNQKEKRELENALIVAGLPGLSDPDLIQQMANLVSAWPGDKHEYMRDLLSECDAEQRYEMYQAIAPRLHGFKALSFSQYEAQIMLKAGAMVSHRLLRVEGARPEPIIVGGEKYVAVPQREASHAVATVRCHHCLKDDRFIADTPVAAMLEARKAGWTREPGVNKECCPECSVAVAATVVRLSNKETLAVYDRRACKLDA